MNKTELMLKNIQNLYNPTKIIKQNRVKQIKKRIIKEAKEQVQQNIKKTEEKPQISNISTLDDTEKQFINKFIEYNELLLLSDECNKLTPIFEKALGDNAPYAIKLVDQKCKERQTKLNELTKQLTEIKQNLQKEAEKVKTKESLISLANSINQQKMPKTQTQDLTDSDQCANGNCAGNIVESKKKKAKK